MATEQGALRRGLRLACVLGSVLLLTAQRGRRGGADFNSAGPTEFSKFNVPYNGRFTYARIRYTPSATGFGGGGGFFGGINYWWDHDYPRADHNFPRILGELTHMSVRHDSSNIIAIGDTALFHFPFAYLCEPAWWTMTDAEAENFGAYLRKGGFVIVDDFAGGGAWANFEQQMRHALPDLHPIRLTVAHPIFHTFFDIASIDMAHPYYRGLRAEFYGYFEDNDPAKRMMMIVNFNNDISESWEFSGTGFIPFDVTNEAFKLGVNYVVYAMTH